MVAKTIDGVLRRAHDTAREIATEVVDANEIGEHTGLEAHEERLVTHYFNCLKPGYVGWQWAITVSRILRSKRVTVCEIDLLPGEGALLAPDWVPWADRLEPGDTRPGEKLPYRAADERLFAKRRSSETPAPGTPLAGCVAVTHEAFIESKRASILERATAMTPESAAGLTVESLFFSKQPMPEPEVSPLESDWPMAQTRIDELDLEIIDSWD